MFLPHACAWLFLYAATASVVVILAYAIVGTALGLPIREVSLFVGPRIAGWTYHGIRYTLRILPFNSTVHFGTPEDDEAPYRETTIMRIHPLLRGVVHLAHPASLLLFSAALVGVTSTSAQCRHTGSALSSIIAGSTRIRATIESLLMFLANAPPQVGVAAVASGLAALAFLPVPGWPVAQTLIECVDGLYPLSLSTRTRLALIGFVVTVAMWGLFTFFLAVRVFSTAPAAA